MSMTNVQSVVSSPKSNGKTKAKLNGSTAVKAPAMTEAQACDAAFEYGKSMAGQDGDITLAFKTFKDKPESVDNIAAALREGYFVRKHSCDRDEAKRIIGLAKYNDRNPEKNTDGNRTQAQQNTMVAVNMLISRAKRFAGITKAVDTVKQEEAKAERDAHQARLIKADEVINPADDVDVFDAMNRLVLSMKAIQKKHAIKLVGDRGSEWRDWLANAPR